MDKNARMSNRQKEGLMRPVSYMELFGIFQNKRAERVAKAMSAMLKYGRHAWNI